MMRWCICLSHKSSQKESPDWAIEQVREDVEEPAALDEVTE